MIDRLERLLNLVIALRETRTPMPAEEIHRRVAGYSQPDHDAFRRMFERDKADLRALGVPIRTTAVSRWDDRNGYHIDPADYDLPEIRLAPGQLAALAIAVQATGLAQDVGTGLLKLAVDADEPEAAAAVPPPRVGARLQSPHLPVLLEASLARRRVRFAYAPPGRDRAVRRVEPYALVHRRGRWYLIGHDRDRGDRRSFRLDRIVGNVTTYGDAGGYEPPAEGFDTDDVLPGAGHETLDAHVVAAPSVAWQVARRARGGGRPAADPRWRGWTEYTVRVADPDDFVAWALEYGPDLVVLRPPTLRAAMLAHLHGVTAR